MANQLNFIETLTISEFKQRKGVQAIQVGPSKKTGKLMFQAGGIQGACRSAGIPTKPMMSYVEGEDGSQFWLLHQEGETGLAAITATL